MVVSTTITSGENDSANMRTASARWSTDGESGGAEAGFVGTPKLEVIDCQQHSG